MLNADYFAYNQYRDYIIYKELAKTEKSPEFKKILESLIDQEEEDFRFWLGLSEQKVFHINSSQIFFFKFLRAVFGLTFTAKFLEGREKKMIHSYSQYAKTVDQKTQHQIAKILEHERAHEQKLISTIKEERVEFLGNVVLGLNDGLIELSGALVGFSFAFGNPLFVALSGLIVGFSASLSMASSAYMQARHEEGKEPVKAAAYTGIAYLIVVAILVAPFFLIGQLTAALITMLATILVIILFLSFYSSVLLDRSFKRQALEMITFSLGVAVITFLIGMIVRQFAPELTV